jgi:hypothetical protein
VADIATAKLLIYGEGCGYSQRLYLLYDGIHYDSLVLASGAANQSGNDLNVLAKRFATTESGGVESFAKTADVEERVIAFAKACQVSFPLFYLCNCFFPIALQSLPDHSAFAL